MNSYRRFWLGTSWKMNGSKAMAEGYAEALARYDWNQFANIVPFVLPPFPFVQTVAARLTGTAVRVGVQNVHWSADGPFTGEALSTMAFEIGARLAEIGHAEHHALFGDTEEIIREKTRLAVAAGLSASVTHSSSRQPARPWRRSSVKRRIALSGTRPLRGRKLDPFLRADIVDRQRWDIC